MSTQELRLSRIHGVLVLFDVATQVADDIGDGQILYD